MVAGTARSARTNDPATWRSSEVATAAYLRHAKDIPGERGLGFVFAKTGILTEQGKPKYPKIKTKDADTLVFVDLDKCLDALTGERSARATGIIRRFHSDRERSPSGTGARRGGTGARRGGTGARRGGTAARRGAQTRYRYLQSRCRAGYRPRGDRDRGGVMKRIDLAALDENIADMTRTAVRIAERDGWNIELYLAISKDIAKCRAVRARVLARRGR